MQILLKTAYHLDLGGNNCFLQQYFNVETKISIMFGHRLASTSSQSCALHLLFQRKWKKKKKKEKEKRK